MALLNASTVEFDIIAPVIRKMRLYPMTIKSACLPIPPP
jgi:hypothetical protein